MIQRILTAAAGFSLLLLSCAGCAPTWHSGDGLDIVRHQITGAQVIEDSLSVQGRISLLCAFTDYGVKVRKAQDNEGRTLEFRSFQIFWAKEYRWEAEFSLPGENATAVVIELEFATRNGKERVQETLPIDRTSRVDYRSMLSGWTPCGPAQP
jgi:hypothetical protein